MMRCGLPYPTDQLSNRRPFKSYCSALVFAPEKSIIRETFERCIPSWIQRKPRVETYWNAMVQTLEGHTSWVSSVAFSPDGKQVVSGSGDRTVRRWDAATGQQLLPALEGHTDGVHSVAFSPDGKQIVSGSGIRRSGAGTRPRDSSCCRPSRAIQGGQLSRLLPRRQADRIWVMG